MRIHWTCTFLFAAACLTPAMSAHASDRDMTVRRMAALRADGIRSGWIYAEEPMGKAAPADIIAMVAPHGINLICAELNLLNGRPAARGSAAMIDTSSFDEQAIATLRDAARSAREHDIVLLVQFMRYSLTALEGLEDATYRCAVDSYGLESLHLACPLNWAFMRAYELPYLRQVARVLTEEGAIGGILYETEEYGADFYPGYHSTTFRVCYCDVCFGEYLDRVAPESELPNATDRYLWLTRQGLEHDYEDHLAARLSVLVRRLGDEIRRDYPGFLFGLYPVSLRWYTRAFAQGLDDSQLPIMLFSATSYYMGYGRLRDGRSDTWENAGSFSSDADDFQMQPWIKRHAPNSLYLGGVMPTLFWPKQFGVELATLLREADGYWIWPLSWITEPELWPFSGKPATQSSEMSFRVAEPDTYWPILHQAHQARSLKILGRETSTEAILLGEPTAMKLRSTSRGEIRSAPWWPDILSVLPPHDPDMAKDGKVPFRIDPTVPHDGPRRTTQIWRTLGTSPPAQLFGAEAWFYSEARDSPAWVSLGRSWSPDYFMAKGEFPGIFSDKNMLLHKAGEWTPVRQIWMNREYAEKDIPLHYTYIRAAVHEARGPVWVLPPEVFPLDVYEWTSEPVMLPPTDRAVLEWRGSDNVFEWRADLIDANTGEVLMGQIDSRFDLSVVPNLYGTHSVKVHLRAYCRTGETPTLKQCTIRHAPPSSRPTAFAPLIEQPLVIDGDASDWSAVRAMNHGITFFKGDGRAGTTNSYGTTACRQIDNADDCRIEFFLAHDGEYLYLLTEVLDDYHEPLAHGAQENGAYLEDTLHVYLDAGNSRTRAIAEPPIAHQPGYMQLAFSTDGNAAMSQNDLTDLGQPCEMAPLGASPDGVNGDAHCTVHREESGYRYVFEQRLRMHTPSDRNLLPIRPGETYGFNVEFCNADHGQTLQGFIWWSSDGVTDAWNNAELWGTVYLEGIR